VEGRREEERVLNIMGLREWINKVDDPDHDQDKEELVWQEDWRNPNTVDAVPGTNWRPGTIN
jgi:hypothetical protein